VAPPPGGTAAAAGVSLRAGAAGVAGSGVVGAASAERGEG